MVDPQRESVKLVLHNEFVSVPNKAKDQVSTTGAELAWKAPGVTGPTPLEPPREECLEEKLRHLPNGIREDFARALV